MPNTWQLSSVLAIFFGIAAFLWAMQRHFARRYAVPPSRFRWLAGGFVLLGLVFTLASVLIGSALVDPVLCRVRFEGTAGLREGDPAVMRGTWFDVRHGERDHEVRVRLLPLRGIEVRGPFRLRLTVVGTAATPATPGAAAAASLSATALVDSELVLPVRSRRFWLPAGSPWETGAVVFRPPDAGRYALRLVPLHPGIRRMDVTIRETGR